MTKSSDLDNLYPVQGVDGASLDSEETSDQQGKRTSYRTFLASGCQRDLDFAESIYREWDRLDNKHRTSQFLQCKSAAWFVVHKVTREVRVQSHSCGLRWCPFCIKSRRYVITSSVTEWLKDRQRPRFITLTLRHRSAPLSEQIADLYYFFRQLRKTAFWRSNVKGGIWFFQVKKTKSGEYWHPHLHVLVEGNYMMQEALRELWRKITHGSYIVDIRAIKSVRKAAAYVARYASAPCRLLDCAFDDALEVVQALHGKRICGTFGSAKGVPLRKLPYDDREDWVTLDSFFNVSLGSSTDEFAATIWQCWVDNKPYTGKLPQPPPDLDKRFQAEQTRSVTFNQMFFEYYDNPL